MKNKIDSLISKIKIHVETTEECMENFNIDSTIYELLYQDNKFLKEITNELSDMIENETKFLKVIPLPTLIKTEIVYLNGKLFITEYPESSILTDGNHHVNFIVISDERIKLCDFYLAYVDNKPKIMYPFNNEEEEDRIAEDSSTKYYKIISSSIQIGNLPILPKSEYFNLCVQYNNKNEMIIDVKNIL